MNRLEALFFDPSLRGRLPGPIAERAAVLAEETLSHGVHTTPDELADLLEATVDFLFRLWVAEFARAGAPDDDAARYLVRMLDAKMTLGKRVGVARTLREVFVRRGIPTAVDGLTAVDFGERGDADHPVARLVAFRNGFAHGNFGALVQEIETHRALLAALLERLPALLTQPVCAVLADGRAWAFRGETEALDTVPAGAPGEGRPFVSAHDGSAPLDLFPLWTVARAEAGAPTLAHPGHGTAVTVEQFFEREALRAYATRWQDELDGLAPQGEALRQRVTRPLGADERTALDAALHAAQLVLVEGHPGCGKAGALVALLDDAAVREGFADVTPVVLVADEPSAQASTFENTVLRAAERALGLAPRAFDHDAAGKKLNEKKRAERLATATDALRAAGRRVLLLVEDAHIGTVPSPREERTVARVVRALVDTPVHVVATAHPGAGATVFPHDRKVLLAVPPQPDAQRLDAAVRALLTRGSLHRAVLAQVVGTAGETTLFPLCDALDAAHGAPVFEPAVERALTDLRPLLVQRRVDGERAWRSFHPAVAAALAAAGEHR